MKILKNQSHFFSYIPKAVFFDLDNTLYDYDYSHNIALDATLKLAENIIAIKKKEFLRLFNSSRSEIKRNLGSVASSHSRLLYFQSLIEKYTNKTQPKLILQLEQCYWHSFLQASKIYPGVIDFLSELKILNIPVVIVTNLTAQIQLRKLVSFNIESYVDYLVTSEEVGVEKPHPDIFFKALEKLNCKRSDGIWMIGDCIDSDMYGAKKSIDAITIQKTNYNNKPCSHSDFCFNNFSELLSVVDILKKKCSRESSVK